MSTPQTALISGSSLTADLVAGDMTALAQHMRDCARAHGRMSMLRDGLSRMHTVAAARIVTFGFATVVIGLALIAIA